MYPDSDEDVPEIDGLKVEPVYSEAQQALIARFGNRDELLVAGNSFITSRSRSSRENPVEVSVTPALRPGLAPQPVRLRP